MVSNESERVWKKKVAAQVRHCLEGLKKITINLKITGVSTGIRTEHLWIEVTTSACQVKRGVWGNEGLKDLMTPAG
jgi:hypothetical protein